MVNVIGTDASAWQKPADLITHERRSGMNVLCRINVRRALFSRNRDSTTRQKIAIFPGGKRELGCYAESLRPEPRFQETRTL